MLQKGKGPRIDKLRIIQLIQADLQMLMCLLILLSDNEIVAKNELNLSQYEIKEATMMSALVEKLLMLKQSKLTRDDLF